MNERHCERSEAIQGQILNDRRICPWIASSLTLLAMTSEKLPHDLRKIRDFVHRAAEFV
jgi:hypothetical protein